MKKSIACLTLLTFGLISCAGNPEKVITKTEYEQKYNDGWAYFPEKLTLRCEITPNGRFATAKTENGRIVGINGTAISKLNGVSIHDLRLVNPDGTDKLGGAGVIIEALELCGE